MEGKIVIVIFIDSIICGYWNTTKGEFLGILYSECYTLTSINKNEHDKSAMKQRENNIADEKIVQNYPMQPILFSSKFVVLKILHSTAS